MVVFAGLSAEGTWTCPGRFPDNGSTTAEALVFEEGGATRRLAVPVASDTPGIAAAAMPNH